MRDDAYVYREHILQRTHSLENTPSAGIDDDDLRDDARAECLSIVVVDRLVARREGTRPRAKTRPEAWQRTRVFATY